MSILCPENCAHLDRVKPQDPPASATEAVFHIPRMVDKRPWLAHAFTELLQAQRAGRFEPGIGDFRVSDETLNTAGKVLGTIRYRSLPSPSVFALPGGGLQIAWRNGHEAVEVSVFPGEGVGIAHLVEDMPTNAMDLDSTEYAKANDFLADLLGCTE